MAHHPTIKRYALAAFQLALERDNLETWREDLGALANLWSNEDLRALLVSRAISLKDKLETLQQLLPEAEPLVHNLIGVMLTHGLAASIPQVSHEFDGLVDAHHGLSRATVTTAVAVDQALMDEIEQWLSSLAGKKLILETQVQPAIVGGFVAKVGDQLFDASTRSRLQQLREKMSSGGAAG